MEQKSKKTEKHLPATCVRPLALIILLISAVPCFAATSRRHPSRRPTAPSPLAESQTALMQGRADDAIAGLRGLIAANPNDGAAHLLLCRAFYSEELAEQAIAQCEAAVADLPNSSQAQDWMGRAYGLKAGRSGPLAGFKLASKVRSAFESAVALDPNNDDAINDLSEYYIGAPSLVGGGIDKAMALASRVESQHPQAAHRIRGLAAEKEHDYGTAEREFKAAVAAGGTPEAWTDLGHFYSLREEKEQALDALQHAVAADRSNGPALVDVATILTKIHSDPELAAKALRDYLASNAKTDAAPAFKANVELGKLLETLGDKQGAEAQFQDALNLAHDYPPAKKAIQHL